MVPLGQKMMAIYDDSLHMCGFLGIETHDRQKSFYQEGFCVDPVDEECHGMVGFIFGAAPRAAKPSACRKASCSCRDKPVPDSRKTALLHSSPLCDCAKSTPGLRPFISAGSCALGWQFADAHGQWSLTLSWDATA
jgi:hypothetical protein